MYLVDLIKTAGIGVRRHLPHHKAIFTDDQHSAEEIAKKLLAAGCTKQENGNKWFPVNASDALTDFGDATETGSYYMVDPEDWEFRIDRDGTINYI